MKRNHRLPSLLVALSLAAAPALGHAQCEQGQSGGGGEIVGTLLGAAIGGLVGSQIGSGTGNKIAIGAGVLAGGLLGNRIGKGLSCRDQAYHGQTAEHALETQRSGTTSTWANPDTGHSGSVTPTRTYQRADGAYCRDFEQTITIDGETELAGGTACRQPDGTWKVVS